MATNQSPRLATVNTLLEGYGSLSVPQLLQTLSSDFQHQVLPASLSMPPRDKEAFAKHATGIFGVFSKFRMVPLSMVDDSSAGRVAVHARMQGTLNGGRGEWTNECVMMIQLSDDWTEVVSIKEFVDSAKAMEMAREHAPEDFGGEGASPSSAKNAASSVGGGTMALGMSAMMGVVVLLLARRFI